MSEFTTMILRTLKVASLLTVTVYAKEVKSTNHLADFFRDLTTFLGAKRPIILTHEEDSSNSLTQLCFQDTKFTCLCYEDGEEETVADHLGHVRRKNGVDLILFGPGDHLEISKRLSTLPSFYSPSVPLIVEKKTFFAADGNLHLRLDRNVMFYNLTTEIVQVSEEFSIRGEVKKIKQILGEWSPMLGFRTSFKSLDLHVRRTDWQGVMLREMQAGSPFNKFKFDSNGTFVSANGMFEDFLNGLKVKLNFSTSQFLPSTKKWGIRLANGSWNGRVGILHSKKADLLGAGLFITSQRNEDIDFRKIYLHGFESWIVTSHQT